MSQDFTPPTPPSDLPLDPPSPAPVNNSFPDKNKFIIITALIAAVALLIGILIANSSSDSSSQTPTTLAAVSNYDETPTYTIPASVNKYDAYLEHVYNNSGKANTMDKSELIEFGDVVCQALDNGKAIGTIVGILNNASNDTRDAELYASIIFGSITHLCDEYEGDLRFYLSNAN